MNGFGYFRQILTLRKESNEPFSMYSTTIMTGRPAEREHTERMICIYHLSSVFSADTFTALAAQHDAQDIKF